MRLARIVFAALLFPSAAFATVDTTEEKSLKGCRLVALLQAPTNISDSFETGDCAGMLSPLWLAGRDLGASSRFRIPLKATTQQMAKIYVGYLDAHPEQQHELASISAIKILVSLAV